MKKLSCNKKANRAFTLLELMVVVATAGVLASIALTAFQGYRLRAKTSEASLSLGKIVEGEVEYFHKNQAFLEAGPTNIPPAPFGPTNADFTADARWAQIGFAMGTGIYFGYQVTAVSPSQVNCDAMADLTGDGISSLFRRSITANGNDISAGGLYVFDELE